MPELKLPPHIYEQFGLYYSRLTGRNISAHKIQSVCDEYWLNNPDNATEVIVDGIKHFKKLKEAEYVEPHTKLDELQPNKKNLEATKKIKVRGPYRKNKATLTESFKNELEAMSTVEDAHYEDGEMSKFMDWLDTELEQDNFTPTCKEDLQVANNAISPMVSPEMIETSKHIIPNGIEDWRYNNSVGLVWIIEDHAGLESLVEEKLAEYGVDWSILKSGMVIMQDSNNNKFWYEEYAAIICHIIYSNIPIPDRIEWISKFMNRSVIQVKQILGIHFKKYSSFRKEDEFYSDFYWDFSYFIGEYFIRYYKYDYSYKYKK